MRPARSRGKLAALGVAALALAVTGDDVLVDTPHIHHAGFSNDAFYFGTVQLAARLEDAAFGSDKQAYYSIDGTNFAPAEIQGSSPVQLVNETTPNEQIGPAVARLSGGGFAVAWVSFSAASDYDVYVRRYNGAGVPLGGEVRVNSATAGAQTQVDVAALADGFVVTWKSLGGTSSGYNVLGQRFDASGAPVGAVLQLSDPVSGDQVDAAVASLADGSFVVVWQSQVPGTSRSQIRARRFDASGAHREASFVVEDDPVVNCADPSVAAQEGDGFAVAWTEVLAGGADDVHGKQYPPGFVYDPVDPDAPTDFRLSQASAGAQRMTAVAAREEGGFFATWSDARLDGSGFGIYAQAFNASGMPLISNSSGSFIDLRIHTQSIGNQVASRIARVDGGDYLVVWADQQVVGRGRIKAQRVDARNLLVGGEIAVSESDFNHQTPVAAPLGDGAFAAAWSTSGDPMDPFLGGVFMRRVADVQLLSPVIDPRRDITVVFRVDQPSTGHSWTSPPRSWIYADPDSGRDGRVVYPDGYTRQATATIGIERPGTLFGYRFNDLYAREAPLAAGVCGAFDDNWQRRAQPFVLVSDVEVTLDDDARCYQFMWRVQNGAGREFEYTSDAILRVDRTPPTVTATSERSGHVLAVSVQVVEATSPVARSFTVNGAPPTPFSGDLVLVPLADGANQVRIDVRDAAGNVGQTGFFVSADLAAPRIDLYTVEEGGTYGPDVPIGYALTRPLANLRMTLDGGAPHPVADLTGLADGPHEVALAGDAEDGTEVSVVRHFQVEAGAFQLSLLSPQDRAYAEDAVTVAWDTSEPPASVSLLLDGAPVPGPELVGLADGEHTLVLSATSAGGKLVTVTRHFSVALASPRLTVMAPADGAVLPGRQVTVAFDANGPVTWTSGAASGSVVSGQTIELPADGAQVLTLTTTLPGGATASRTRTLTADSQAPQVTLSSPASQLYAFNSLPIDWTANKSLSGIKYWLDGSEVTSLDGLEDGVHHFLLTAQDDAGRTVQAIADFQVASLEILAPVEGQRLVDNDFPPSVDLVYASGGGFTTLSASADGQAGLLLPAPSGTYPLQLAGGPHEVTVTGTAAGQTLVRRVGFSVGARNVRAGPHAIDYTYANCTTDLVCDVTVTLRVDNRGDYDIPDTFDVEFEALDAAGTARRYTWTVDGILRSEHRTRTLTPFSARFEDRFKVVVDPAGAILGEDGRDNVQEMVFQAGKITSIDTDLSFDNFYVHGARVDNLFEVAAVGGVAFVELEASGVYFRTWPGEHGFVSPVDMGMLSPLRNCVLVRAYASDNRLLDTDRRCFEVHALDSSVPYNDRTSPWRAFIGAGNRIDIRTVDQQFFARQELASMRLAMSAGGVVIFAAHGGLDYSGRPKVNYTAITSDRPSLANMRPDQLSIGVRANLDLSRGGCIVSGFAPITWSDSEVHAIDELFDDLLARANARIDELEPDLQKELDKSLTEQNGWHQYGLFKSLAELDPAHMDSTAMKGIFVLGGLLLNLHVAPPKINDVQISYAGQDRFELMVRSAGCALGFGPGLQLTSHLAFDAAYRRGLVLDMKLQGGSAQTIVLGGGLGFVLIFPVALTVQIGWATASFADMARFTGQAHLQLHAVSGLAVSPAPLALRTLTLEEASARARMRIPHQSQRAANIESYSFGLAMVLVLPVFTYTHGDVSTNIEVEVDTDVSGNLREPIVLMNPEFVASDLPDTKELIQSRGQLYTKATAHMVGPLLICALFVVVPHCWTENIDKSFTLTDKCQGVKDDGTLVDAPRGTCPASVTDPLNPPPLPTLAPSRAPPG